MHESSERLMRLLRGERVAKPPFCEIWFGMEQFRQKSYGGDMLALAADLDIAGICVGGVGSGINLRKPVERDPQTGVWYGGGLLRDWEQLKQTPVPDYAAEAANILPARQRCADAGLACWIVLPWCFHVIATNMGLEEFALACYDRPQFVADAMRWVEERTGQAIEQVIAQVRPDFVLYDGDCAYKTGPMIQPAMLREFCFAPTLANTRRLRQLGIPVAFHSDGQLDEIIPVLLDLGISMVHGCEAAANDLGHLVEKFGDKIALAGNMDVVFLKNATPAEVTAATRRMLEVGARRQRFIAACNTSPLDYIPAENYRAFAAAIREGAA